VDKNIVRIAEMLEYSGISKFFKVVIPSISTYLLIGLKESLSRTWRTVIAIEMIAATMYGLGYMTYDSMELLNTPLMFVGIITSGLIYLSIDQGLLRFIEKITVIKWGMKKSYE